MTESSTSKPTTPADTLSEQIGVLVRREVEARILAPVIQALGERFGREAVLETLKESIVAVARSQGAQMAEILGGCDREAFMVSLGHWQKDGALELEILSQEDGRLDFNVTRCRYAEMYLALGIPELGDTLSCNRDFAFIEGFNPDARLTRTQTIMSGAPHCDFRFQFPTD